MLALLASVALAGDATSIVDVLDSFSFPLAGSNTYTRTGAAFVYDRTTWDVATDCSGFTSYVLWDAWLHDHDEVFVGGKAIKSASYTMNGIDGASTANHGPVSSHFVTAIQDGWILVDGVQHALDVRTDPADIAPGDVLARSGHVAFIEGTTRITEDFWILDVLQLTSASALSRSTLYLGRTFVNGEPTFTYYSTSSKLRANDGYTAHIAGFGE